MKPVYVVLMLFAVTFLLSACCNCPKPPQSYLDEAEMPKTVELGDEAPATRDLS